MGMVGIATRQKNHGDGIRQLGAERTAGKNWPSSATLAEYIGGVWRCGETPQALSGVQTTTGPDYGRIGALVSLRAAAREQPLASPTTADFASNADGLPEPRWFGGQGVTIRV